MGSSLRLAWDCAVRLEAQLGEADRPWEERNRWLQENLTGAKQMQIRKGGGWDIEHELELGFGFWVS